MDEWLGFNGMTFYCAIFGCSAAMLPRVELLIKNFAPLFYFWCQHELEVKISSKSIHNFLRYPSHNERINKHQTWSHYPLSLSGITIICKKWVQTGWKNKIEISPVSCWSAWHFPMSHTESQARWIEYACWNSHTGNQWNLHNSSLVSITAHHHKPLTTSKNKDNTT